MSPVLHAHLYGDHPCPPCPACSFARQEHGPESLYPIAEDVLRFPSIMRGRSGWQVIGCHHTLPLRLRSFATYRRGCWAWRGTIARLNETRP